MGRCEIDGSVGFMEEPFVSTLDTYLKVR